MASVARVAAAWRDKVCRCHPMTPHSGGGGGGEVTKKQRDGDGECCSREQISLHPPASLHAIKYATLNSSQYLITFGPKRVK